MDTVISGKAPETEKTRFQLFLIQNLQKEIENVRRLDPESLAAEIKKLGFSCQRCGKCCRRAFGDNRVLVLPSEIQRIQEKTGLSKLEVAGPLIPDLYETDVSEAEDSAGAGMAKAKPDEKETFQYSKRIDLPGDIDSEGNIHSYGWMLRRKRNGDCIFIERDTSRCRVHPFRPMLCRTYPFYMEDLKLHVCECEGLGYPISKEESLLLARDLLSRHISELEDMLAMYKKFENFETGINGLKIAKANAEKGEFSYIVHDSNGQSRVLDAD